MPVSAALLRHAEQRRKRLENRIADQITRFAGSMQFVYLHVVWFGLWIGLRVERYPFGLLTMIVSLEAIFLSTFDDQPEPRRREAPGAGRSAVADGPGRGAARPGATPHLHQILELTKAIHAIAAARTPAGPTQSDSA